MGGMASGPAITDLISQLQSEVNGLCAKLFNFLGALQRDAPPQSVKSEGLPAPAGGVDVEVRHVMTFSAPQLCFYMHNWIPI